MVDGTLRSRMSKLDASTEHGLRRSKGRGWHALRLEAAQVRKERESADCTEGCGRSPANCVEEYERSFAKRGDEARFEALRVGKEGGVKLQRAFGLGKGK